jgi:chromate transporter
MRAAPAPVVNDPPLSLHALAAIAGKVGLLAVGGPAAHVALLEREFVQRRRLVDPARFLELLSGTYLLPGPNSTQLVLLLGHQLRGVRGLVAMGLAFILPGALICSVGAWLYLGTREIPAVEKILQGIQPVVLGIILGSMFRLVPASIRSARQVLLLVAAVVLALAGLPPLAVLALGAIGGLVPEPWVRSGRGLHMVVPAPLVALGIDAEQLAHLSVTLLKIAVTVFGGGYVLIAYLQTDIVAGAGLVSPSELLDLVAIAQVTPGPLFAVASAIGFVAAGVPGAIVATIAIFAPSIVLTAAVGGGISRWAAHPRVAAALRGVVPAVAGLLLAVTIGLAGAVLGSWMMAVLALVCAALSANSSVGYGRLLGFGGAVGVVLVMTGG